MSDGKVVIDTSLNNKGFVKGINGLKKDTGGLTSAIKKLGSVIASVFVVKAIVDFGKESVKAASNLSNALIGLQSVVEGQGKSFARAKGFIDSYIKDGLVPMENAVTAYKNLSSRGYSTEQIERTMVALKDAAAFGRQASYTLGDAVTSATEGLKNENSVLVDNAGVTKNVAKMWDDYAKSIGVTAANLTKGQKIQAEVNGILEETRFQTGDAAKVAGTYAGQVSMLAFTFNELKISVGNAIMPIAKAVIPAISSIIQWLTKLANVFRQVTALLFGGESIQMQSAASDAEQVSEAIGGSVENQEALTNATKDTAKAQKKALAGFDEINKLSGETPAGTAAGGGSSGLPPTTGAIVVPPIDTPQIADNPQIVAFLDNLRKAIQPTTDALSRLWEQLKLVGSFTGDALVDFYGTFLKPVGAWVMGEGLPQLIDAVRNGLTLIDWQKINDALHTLWVALEPFAVNVGEGLLWLLEKVLIPLGTWTMNEVVPLFIKAIAETLGIFRAVWDAVKPGLEWLWENFLLPVAQWTGGIIVSVLKNIVDALGTVSDWCVKYADKIRDIAIVVGSFATAWWLVNAAVTAWNIVSAIATGATTAFGVAVAFLTSPITVVVLAIGALIAIITLLVIHWDEVKAGATACWEGIKQAWQAAGAWLNETVVIPISTFFKDLWNNIGVWALGAWEAIAKTFGSVAAWFTDHVITPVSSGFKGFINGMISMVEGFVNFFIDGINSIISAINSISFDLPDLIGGGHIGFDLSPVQRIALPRLATGAVIPPNREFMAVLGDQKSGNNYEVPDAKLRQLIREESGSKALGEITVILELDRQQLGKAVYKLNRAESRRIGVQLVEV